MTPWVDTLYMLHESSQRPVRHLFFVKVRLRLQRCEVYSYRKSDRQPCTGPNGCYVGFFSPPDRGVSGSKHIRKSLHHLNENLDTLSFGEFLPIEPSQLYCVAFGKSPYFRPFLPLKLSNQPGNPPAYPPPCRKKAYRWLRIQPSRYTIGSPWSRRCITRGRLYLVSVCGCVQACSSRMFQILTKCHYTPIAATSAYGLPSTNE